MKTGKFIISLDFELHWGGVEKWDLHTKKNYFETTRTGIPKMLTLFEQYDIAATWATVGFLFAKDKSQLIRFSPNKKPGYANPALNYYNLVQSSQLGQNEQEDPFHFATSLIEKILETPKQELASHTFSHFYCNETGQTLEDFRNDLQAAQTIAAENFGLTLQSLVFPRNQYNERYLDVVRETGFKVVRSNPDVWFWRQEQQFAPLLRAFDTLGAISKPLSFTLDEGNKFKDLCVLPASRFLRPYTSREKLLQPLKKKRVLHEMTQAAKNGAMYHLWWHPHNFGSDLSANLDYLEEILRHYSSLKAKYGFQSSSMITACE